MLFLYRIMVDLYGLAIRLLAWFGNSKARKWSQGRKNWAQNLKSDLASSRLPRLWFHAASLGEYEQARPVITEIQTRFASQFEIVLSFFSPSGYEVRKNNALANWVVYLPLDTPSNARRFVDLVRPEAVFFVKYEFWYFHIKEVQKRNIPLILFSAVFRPQQIFFKSYGKRFRTLLAGYTQLFVQNADSAQLLGSIGLKQVQIAGDTRFDRVWETQENPKDFPWAKAFKDGQTLLVIGSCWPADLEVLLPYLAQYPKTLQVIFAPHEIKESVMKSIENQFPRPIIRHSHIEDDMDLRDYSGLIIDNIGMLSSLYQYADCAFVGGAFKEGLHNILEPAVFGIPVFFGPRYQKYPEASALIQRGGAFSIANVSGLAQSMSPFLENLALARQKGQANRNYIYENRGGAQKIVEYFASIYSEQ